MLEWEKGVVEGWEEESRGVRDGERGNKGLKRERMF